MARELTMSHAVLGTVVTIVINSIVVAVAFGRISQQVENDAVEIKRISTEVRRIDTEGSAIWRTTAPGQRDGTMELIKRVDRIETKLDRLIERDRAAIPIPDAVGKRKAQ